MPPCLDKNCPDHSTLVTKIKDLNETKDNKTKDNDKTLPKKGKYTKNNADDFAFPSKTARPTTSTPVLEPIVVQNSYVNLDQDPEIPVDNTTETSVPKPPTPVFLKTKNNYREQINKLMKKFTNLKSKSSGKYIKLNIDSHDDRRDLINVMDDDKDIEFYVVQPKENKPIKIVIKDLPGCTQPNEIISDLEDQGYTVNSCNQLISKRIKLPLPFYLVTMPRNTENLTVFHLSHLGYMQVKIEGYSVKGTTQCL
ncbi:nucleic-acid-binding protein from transposon X-element [Trichonephila clavipes]|nr:nucleic-acid-binding protein from transposon X-element [Trichonephila clavipes]